MDFLWPLGWPAMEKNSKSYKYSVHPWAGFQGTTIVYLLIVSTSSSYCFCYHTMKSINQYLEFRNEIPGYGVTRTINHLEVYS